MHLALTGRRKKTIMYYAIKSVDKSQKARVLQEVCTVLDCSGLQRLFIGQGLGE